ncbi:MAG: DUF3127 domain-containing protein [Muribaculaceae bacterium]
MEISGKIIHDLGEMSGVSKAGNSWKKHEYVLETKDSYPKQVHFDFFGERADQYPLSIGDDIKLSFDIESREYNGRWFTSIRGWKAEKADGAAVSQAPVQQAQSVAAAPVQQPAAPQQPDFGSSATDDLPF